MNQDAMNEPDVFRDIIHDGGSIIWRQKTHQWNECMITNQLL